MTKRLRRGATLIELLVALLLLDMGLAVLGGMSAVAVRRIADANRRARATMASRTRIQRLMSQPCTATASGEGRLDPGVAEMWSSQGEPGSRRLTDSVTVRNGKPPEIVLEVRVPC
jgi:Tfp pilus assembly protein PilV